jgi:hypothetical protein
MLRNLSQITLILLLVCSGCNDTRRNKEHDSSNKVKLYSSATRTYKYSDQNCGEKACTNISLEYPEFTGSSDLDHALNEQISLALRGSISNFVFKSSGEQTLPSLVKNFIAGFNDFKDQFPEVKSIWYVHVKTEIAYQNPDFISIITTTDSYTGGAYSNNEVNYDNFSSYGDRVNDLKFFFLDKEQLLYTAENEFRNLKNIAKEKSLADAGFSFKNDEFSLSDEFGFTNEGFVVYFNNYEIASFAEGFTELVIPFESLGTNYRFH